MANLVTKLPSQYSVGSDGVTTDWIIFYNITLPTVSGIYMLNVSDNVNGGANTTQLWYTFTINVLNTICYTAGIWQMYRTALADRVFVVRRAVASSTSDYIALNGGSVPLSEPYCIMVNNNSGLLARNKFSATLSRIG
jgi:hypothetical protein